MDGQDVRKIMLFNHSKSNVKFLRSLQDGGIVIGSEVFINIFNLLCVRIKIKCVCSDLLLNI